MTKREAMHTAHRLVAAIIDQAIGAGGWREDVDLNDVYADGDAEKIADEIERHADAAEEARVYGTDWIRLIAARLREIAERPSCVPVHGATETQQQHCPDCEECNKPEQWEALHKQAAKLNDLYLDLATVKRERDEVERLRKRVKELETGRKQLEPSGDPGELPPCPKCKKTPLHRAKNCVQHRCEQKGRIQEYTVDLWIRYVAENTPCRECGEMPVRPESGPDGVYCGNYRCAHEGELVSLSQWIVHNGPGKGDG